MKENHDASPIRPASVALNTMQEAEPVADATVGSHVLSDNANADACRDKGALPSEVCSLLFVGTRISQSSAYRLYRKQSQSRRHPPSPDRLPPANNRRPTKRKCHLMVPFHLPVTVYKARTLCLRPYLTTTWLDCRPPGNGWGKTSSPYRLFPPQEIITSTTSFNFNRHVWPTSAHLCWERTAPASVVD